MTSMAAALAASLPQVVPQAQQQQQQREAQAARVPARLEGLLDVEAAVEVESVKLNSLVGDPSTRGSVLTCTR